MDPPCHHHGHKCCQLCQSGWMNANGTKSQVKDGVNSIKRMWVTTHGPKIKHPNKKRWKKEKKQSWISFTCLLYIISHLLTGMANEYKSNNGEGLKCNVVTSIFCCQKYLHAQAANTNNTWQDDFVSQVGKVMGYEKNF